MQDIILAHNKQSMFLAQKQGLRPTQRHVQLTKRFKTKREGCLPLPTPTYINIPPNNTHAS